MDECIASQCLAVPSICLTAFHFSPLQGGWQWGRGMGYATSSVKDANGFFFKRSPFFGVYYGNASASNALSPWRGLPSHSSTFLLLLCPCSPFFFNDILKRAALSWASLWPSDSFEVGPKKEKAKKCALTFSVCGCHWPSTVYGIEGGKKHFRILMCRLLPFMAAQLTTTTATKRTTTANRARQQDSCQLALSEKAAVLQTWP